MKSELGRLKKTLSKHCPECNTILQLRIREEDILIKGEILKTPEGYEYCHRCGYEQEIESKIKRKKKFEKIELIEKEEPKKVWKNNKTNNYKK